MKDSILNEQLSVLLYAAHPGVNIHPWMVGRVVETAKP